MYATKLLSTETTGGGIAQHDDLLALLVTLHPEVSRTGVLMAASASLANALAAGHAGVKTRALITHFPRESASLLLVSKRIERWYGASPLSRLVSTFNRDLSLAKDASLRLISQGAAWPATETVSDFSNLATAWQTSCRSALALLDGLDEIFACHGMVGPASERSPLLTLLDCSAKAEYPLIGASGQVIMPPWAERRQFERTPLRWPAQIFVAGQADRAIVRDMSATGIGLECGFDLQVGTRVVLEVGSALRVEGTVAWASDHRAGLELEQPLHSAAPELAFCSKLSRFNPVFDHASGF